MPFGDREFAPSIGKPGYVVPLSLAGFPISAVAFAEDRSEFLMVARWPRQDRGEQRSLWAYHELIRFKIDGRSVVEEERVELPFQVARMHYMDDQDAVVLVTGERRPKICVWSLKSMSLLGSLRLEECSLTSVAYNSAVNEIAIGTREGQIVRIGLAVEE
ncbi:MAG: hypothetical protein DWQ41_22685 [Planctomycetota bacterium]|nr:MAG: hypothetical protein DWQ41_22685 [Planctomycetota bacterium]